MIIAENPQYYRLISQNDHGDLAGQFAAHWGNEQFAKLTHAKICGSSIPKVRNA